MATGKNSKRTYIYNGARAEAKKRMSKCSRNTRRSWRRNKRTYTMLGTYAVDVAAAARAKG